MSDREARILKSEEEMDRDRWTCSTNLTSRFKASITIRPMLHLLGRARVRAGLLQCFQAISQASSTNSNSKQLCTINNWTRTLISDLQSRPLKMHNNSSKLIRLNRTWWAKHTQSSHLLWHRREQSLWIDLLNKNFSAPFLSLCCKVETTNTGIITPLELQRNIKVT